MARILADFPLSMHDTDRQSPAAQPAPADASRPAGKLGPHDSPASASGEPRRPREIGGPPGPEPTRYGDWEKNGRCIDF
jgi:hypothetical protein